MENGNHSIANKVPNEAPRSSTATVKNSHLPKSAYRKSIMQGNAEETSSRKGMFKWSCRCWKRKAETDASIIVYLKRFKCIKFEHSTLGESRMKVATVERSRKK